MAGIYETKGRAREYCELALNQYICCENGCRYCYSPAVTHIAKEVYSKPKMRVKLGVLMKEAANLKGEQRPILMSFISDPYPNIDAEEKNTRTVIEILKANGLHFNILTKAGNLAQRDFDLYRPGDAFATTLTLDNDRDSLKWEPRAALPAERIANLKEAHRRGIKTWVSCEPVIYPDQTMELIRMTHEFVDSYKVGVLNYHPHGRMTDWKRFGNEVAELLNKLGCRAYIKTDLAEYLGKKEGFWIEN